MTVGIAAIAENDGNPYAVVSADRMVTVGRGDGVEYEDNSSKIETFLHTDDVCAVAIGAGQTVYINEMFKVLNEIGAANSFSANTVSKAAEFGKRAYQKVVQKTVEDKVLSPLDYSLDDLRDEETHVPYELQRKFAEDAEKWRSKFREKVHLIIAGVGRDGAGVYMIAGGESTNHSDQGYRVIGTGSNSAQLSFIRRRYDPDCSMEEAMLTVAEAKSQSEERQGVGQQMDISLITQSTIKRLDKKQKSEVRDAIKQVSAAENEKRQTVMDSWDLS